MFTTTTTTFKQLVSGVIMMLYNPREDILTQTDDRNESNTYLVYNEDVVVEHTFLNSRVYQIKNASRHIKQSVLEKMVDENEYMVRVDIRTPSPWENNSESENWKIQTYVLQKVERTIPEHIVKEWVEIRE